jgi:hypothetical protein
MGFVVDGDIGSVFIDHLPQQNSILITDLPVLRNLEGLGHFFYDL